MRGSLFFFGFGLSVVACGAFGTGDSPSQEDAGVDATTVEVEAGVIDASVPPTTRPSCVGITLVDGFERTSVKPNSWTDTYVGTSAALEIVTTPSSRALKATTSPTAGITQAFLSHKAPGPAATFDLCVSFRLELQANAGRLTPLRLLAWTAPAVLGNGEYQGLELVVRRTEVVLVQSNKAACEGSRPCLTGESTVLPTELSSGEHSVTVAVHARSDVEVGPYGFVDVWLDDTGARVPLNTVFANQAERELRLGIFSDGAQGALIYDDVALDVK